MDNKTELDPSTWFSTYGLLTSSNILGTLNIYLSEEDLLPAIKKSSSVYHQLLAIPIKNVLNGIFSDIINVTLARRSTSVYLGISQKNRL